MGETRVDLQHLLEDLRDAYAFAIEETILTEILANALDAGASTIVVSTRPPESALTIVDDGRGMQRRELARYHDLAASTKQRGEGIGFAGVGIKLGLLVSTEVLTESRRGATHVASSWRLASRHRAPWKWVPPPGLVATRGTGVRLTLASPLSLLLDSGFLESAVRRHFEPLLDPVFEGVLRKQYPRGVRIEVDGRVLALQALPPGRDRGQVMNVNSGSGHERDPVAGVHRVPVAVRLARRRTPSAVGYLARSPVALPEDRQGLAISTFGKVIKRGWDWLGVTPVAPDRVTGLVEVPELAGCLTLNKNDFLRAGPRGAMYLAYRKSLQEVVTRQLASWGDARDERQAPPRMAKIDRDLARVLEDLAGEFPLLHSLVDRRPGGQKRLPMPDGGAGEAYRPLLSIANAAEAAPVEDGSEAAEPPGANASGLAAPPADADPAAPGAEPPESAAPPQSAPAPPDSESAGPDQPAGALPGSGSTRRRARYGLSLQFERREDDDEPGRLVENTIWINESHPAFQRAQASRSLGYHVALAVALALAPLAVSPAEEHGFITRFLAEWGDAHAPRTPRAKTPPRRRR